MLASSGQQSIFRCNAGSAAWENKGFRHFFRPRYKGSATRQHVIWLGESKGFPSSSCLEWRYTLPLLEDAGLEAWAVDILGWGFSDLEQLPSCDMASKRDHFYEFWRSYIQRPMVLVGPSLGAAVAIDFAVTHPNAVNKLVLIDASVHSKGTGRLSRLPKSLAYAGVSILKSVPLRLTATLGMFNKSSISSIFDRTAVGRLHCLFPWWKEATVDFMLSGGYDVTSQISQVTQKTLVIWGGEDRIVDITFAPRLNQEIPNSVLHIIPDCGHIPHVEKPEMVAKLITDFVLHEDPVKEAQEQKKSNLTPM